MMNDNVAHALVLEHRDADLAIEVETNSHWWAVVTAPNSDAVQVSRHGGADVQVSVWNRAGNSRIMLREDEARALIALLQAAVD